MAAVACRGCAMSGPLAAILGAIVPLLVYAGLCCLVPGLVRRDRVLALGAGILVVALVWTVAAVVLPVFPLSPRASPVLAAFTYGAGLEETSKLLALLVLWRLGRAAAARDPLPFATGIACGFAAAENILTLWRAAHPMRALFERMLLALPAHTAYAAIMAAVLARVHPSFGARGCALALLAAILCHGLYDAVSLAGLRDLTCLIAALLAAITAWAWWHRLRQV
jgi:RsiW-degrading membrane proteinase PrsW (M82 family)